MKKRLSKTVAALISITCLCNIMTASYDGRVLFPQKITSASSAGSSVPSYSETDILTLRENSVQVAQDNLSVAEVITPPSVSESGSCVSFDEATGTLTLSGNIVVDEVIAYANNDAVKKVTASSGTVFPENSLAIFLNFKATEIDLSNADTSNVTNMQSMFDNCINLKQVDISSFDTSNVTNMSFMFRGCSSLESLDVSSFDTSNVTNMSFMFCNCSSLSELDVSHFVTTNTLHMNYIFMGCSNLNELDVSNFDTSNVNDYSSMFTSCSKLKELDLSNFYTANCWGSMSDMFAGCSSLEKVDVSSFNVIHVYLMNSMFDGCTSLTELDLSSFSTKYISSMSSMFRNCKNLETIYVSGEWSTESARFGLGGMFDMFEGCNKIKGGNGTTYGEYPELYGMMSRIDTDGAPGYLTAKGEVPEKESVFFDKETGTLYLKGEIIHKEVREYRLSPFIKSVVAEEGAVLPEKCGALFSQFKAESIDLSKADESKVTGMGWMFSECTALNELELGNIDTSQCTDMSWMFYKCSGIEELDLSSLDTRNVRDLSSMFSFCSSLKRLDISNFDTSSCETAEYMFGGCSSLEELDVSSFDTSKINDFSSMFGGCENLKELDVSGFHTDNASDMSGMFGRCSSLEEIDVSNFDTSNVKEISNMFRGCSNLTVLNLSSFDTRKVYRLDFMFEECSKLKTIYVSDNWNDGIPSHKYYTEGIFRGCFNLVGGNGTVYDVYHTEMDRACIDTPEKPGYLTKAPLIFNWSRFFNFIIGMSNNNNSIPGARLIFDFFADSARRNIDSEINTVTQTATGTANTVTTTTSTSVSNSDSYWKSNSSISDDIGLFNIFNQMPEAYINSNNCSKNANNTFLLKFKPNEPQIYNIYVYGQPEGNVELKVYDSNYEQVMSSFGKNNYQLNSNKPYYIRACFKKDPGSEAASKKITINIQNYIICNVALEGEYSKEDGAEYSLPQHLFDIRGDIMKIFCIKPDRDYFYRIDPCDKITIHTYKKNRNTYEEIKGKEKFLFKKGSEYIIAVFPNSTIDDKYKVDFIRESYLRQNINICVRESSNYSEKTEDMAFDTFEDYGRYWGVDYSLLDEDERGILLTNFYLLCAYNEDGSTGELDLHAALITAKDMAKNGKTLSISNGKLIALTALSSSLKGLEKLANSNTANIEKFRFLQKFKNVGALATAFGAAYIGANVYNACTADTSTYVGRGNQAISTVKAMRKLVSYMPGAGLYYRVLLSAVQDCIKVLIKQESISKAQEIEICLQTHSGEKYYDYNAICSADGEQVFLECVDILEKNYVDKKTGEPITEEEAINMLDEYIDTRMQMDIEDVTGMTIEEIEKFFK